MGYYTRFELTTNENTYKVSDIISYMKKHNVKSDKFYPFEYEFDDLLFDENVFDLEMYSEECKWYDHGEEMIELSKQFPNVIFCLEGEGEESGDIWRTYYKNGKKQHCPAKIVFDKYDERKLK